MSKQTKEALSPVRDILDILDQWSRDPHNAYMLLAVSSDDQGSFTSLSSIQGPKGTILAGAQDLIKQYPTISELFTIAQIQYNRKGAIVFS